MCDSNPLTSFDPAALKALEIANSSRLTSFDPKKLIPLSLKDLLLPEGASTEQVRSSVGARPDLVILPELAICAVASTFIVPDGFRVIVLSSTFVETGIDYVFGVEVRDGVRKVLIFCAHPARPWKDRKTLFLFGKAAA